MVMQDKNFDPLKKAFENNSWYWEESKELFANITVKNKGDMWLYNYNEDVLVPRNHPVLVRCRGIVVSTTGQVLNYPLDRFFNDYEKECADIDWDSALVQEKVDGSMVCVFWNGGGWEITTRGSFYPIPNADLDFADLFKKHFSSFDELWEGFCYCFELVSPQNRIVKWYDEAAIYLITIRSIIDDTQLNVSYLEEIAELLGVKLPKVYSASSVEKCKELFKDFAPDDEGLVVVDKHFNRMKLKQGSYLKLAKIKMLKEQDLFEYVLGKTTIDPEFLERLPEIKEAIADIYFQWNNIILPKINHAFCHIQSTSRKEFALQAVNYPFKKVLFQLYDRKDLKLLPLKWGEVKTW